MQIVSQSSYWRKPPKLKIWTKKVPISMKRNQVNGDPKHQKVKKEGPKTHQGAALMSKTERPRNLQSGKCSKCQCPIYQKLNMPRAWYIKDWTCQMFRMENAQFWMLLVSNAQNARCSKCQMLNMPNAQNAKCSTSKLCQIIRGPTYQSYKCYRCQMLTVPNAHCAKYSKFQIPNILNIKSVKCLLPKLPKVANAIST